MSAVSPDPIHPSNGPARDHAQARLGLRVIGIVTVLGSVLATAAALVAWRGYDAQRDRALEGVVVLAGAAASNVDDYLRDRLDLLGTVAVSPSVRGADPVNMRSYFTDVQVASPTFAAIAWVDIEGTVRVRVPTDPAAPLNVADRGYFQAVLATSRPFVSDALVSRVDNQVRVVLAVPTQDRNGTLTGVLTATVSLEQVGQALAAFRTRPTHAVIVVDRLDQLIVDGTVTPIANPSTAPLLARARAERSGVLDKVPGLRGEKDRLLAFRAVPASDWIVFIEEPREETFGTAQRTLLLTLSGLLGMMLAGVTGAVWAGRRMDRLAQEQARALRESEALRHVARLVNSRLEMDEVLRLVAEQACALFGADFAAVATQERGRATPVWRTIVGGRSRVWQVSEMVPSGIAERVALTQAPVVIDRFDPSDPDAQDLPIHLAEGLRTSLSVPLLHGAAVLGILTVAWREERVVREAGIRLAQALASSAAVAVGNARLYQETQQAVRVRDEFLASASHELRTPLSHIKGFVSTLRQPDVDWDAETQRDFLTEIERETDRLARMIGDVLDISHIEAGGVTQSDRTPVDVRALIMGGVDRVRVLVDGRSVLIDVPRDLPPIRVDASQIERVIANLVENAAKYSPATGAITITARRSHGELELRVEDEGPGIPAGYHERIFERFVRVDSSDSSGIRGTGLGLAICRGIVRAHGGWIWAEDREGGAAIVVRLPLSADIHGFGDGDVRRSAPA